MKFDLNSLNTTKKYKKLFVTYYTLAIKTEEV